MMFVKDVVVDRVERAYDQLNDARKMAISLMEAAEIVQEVPLERFLGAVKEEVAWILEQGRKAAFDAWLASPHASGPEEPGRTGLAAWHNRVVHVLDPGTPVFPRGTTSPTMRSSGSSATSSSSRCTGTSGSGSGLSPRWRRRPGSRSICATARP